MTPRHTQIADIVLAAHDGISANDICRRVEMSVTRVLVLLRELLRCGVVSKTALGGGSLLWCSPERQAELVRRRRETCDGQRTAKKAAARRIRRQSEMAQRIAVVVGDEADSWPVVQRLVAAADAPRVKRPAVSCVWDLAR